MHQNRIYPKSSDILSPNRTCTKILTSPFYYLSMCLNNSWIVANSVDPDQTPRSAASDLGLHCLLKLFY